MSAGTGGDPAGAGPHGAGADAAGVGSDPAGVGTVPAAVGSDPDRDGSAVDGDGSAGAGSGGAVHGSAVDGDGSAADGERSGRDGDGSAVDGDGSAADGDGPADDGDGSGRDGHRSDPEGDRSGRDGDQALVPVAADPEEADGEALGADPARPWWRPSPAAVLVGLLLGLLGFALAVQVRSNTSTSGLPAARQEDLVRILDDLSSREERLRRQIADLEAARSRLSTTGDRTSTALAEARTRSTALGILAGTVPAQGPGVELSISDPARRLAAEDLLDAVEELRAAGAEAIQVGGVRIGLDSAFTRTDRGIAVDGVPLAVPYAILAIGDPSTLATAMDIPGGVSDTAGRAGGRARITQRDLVRITVLRTPRTPRSSEPAD